MNFQNRDTDWVEIPHSESLNTTRELTILAWIRPDDIENTDGIVTKGTTRASWALGFHATNGLRFTANAGFNLDDPNDPNYAPGAIGSGDRQSVFEVPEVNEPAGIDWSFVGAISDTRSLRFILNLKEEMVPAAYIFAESNEPLILGSYGGMYFNGLIDEVRIYNRALSRREVIAISGLAEKPFEPEPADGATGILSGELSWGRIGGTDKVYVGTDPSAMALVNADAAGSYSITEIVPGQQYFWRVDVVTAEGEIMGDVWTFTVAQNTASGPNPSDGAEFGSVDGLSLSWLPAFGATAYDVYYGVNPDALGLLGQVTETSYEDPDRILLSETLHYWRIDAVKDAEVVAGPVWSFMTMSVFVVEPNLAAWYKFELGEGTKVVDWTRKGNEGVLVGDAKWSNEGYAGWALQLDGAADYVEIPRVVQDDWTIMLWLRTDNLQQSRPGKLGTLARVRHGAGLIDGDSGGQTENFAFTINGDTIVANCMAEGQGDGRALASNAKISAANWHHVAWTRNAASGDMTLFIDGAPDNSGQNDKWKGTKDAQDFIWIGGLQYGMSQQYFEGMIDEVKFFNRILNEDEIKDEMRPDKRLAFSPQPTPGTVLNQEKPVTLAWTPGDGATAHNVYLGTSIESLPLVSAAQDANGYNAGLLEPATYYWQIGVIQPDGAEVKGDVWNFIVAEYLIVDDFEDYDVGNKEIWWIWKDGLGYAAVDSRPAYPGNGTGSAVGDETTPSYTEETIVNSGNQSMPIQYINDGSTGKALYSEVERTFDSAQDWTRKESKVLSLWFRGYPPIVGSFTEAPISTYTMTAAGTDITGTADEFHYAFKTLTGPGSIIARIQSISETHAWAKAGVMIRETLDPNSTHAMVCVTPGNGVAFQGRTTTGGSSFSSNETEIIAPRWVKLERDVMGNFTASHSADGSTWVPVGNSVPTLVTMSSNVYVGLVLTSHNTALTCEAVFSNVTIDGVASQQWMNQDIGILGNDAEPLYVALSDGTGASALVIHEDPGAATIDTWTEWVIPLQTFADQGLDLADVDRIAIGLGTQGNLTIPGGSGKMFIDDIRLYQPTQETQP